MNKITIAAIQMTSTANLNENLTIAEHLLAKACKLGAKLIVLPENFAMLAKNSKDYLSIAEKLNHGKCQRRFKEWAKRYKVWLVAGTFPLISGQHNKCYSSCLVYDETGELQARYDKIHLFDVTVPNSTETHSESSIFLPGKRAVTVKTPWGKLGVAICYDLRFPELFRTEAYNQVDIIALPAAFTYSTGKAHWDILIRARAIENQCFLIAAAQSGTHENSRKTYGHSMVVNPWGEIIQCSSEGQSTVIGTIDFDYLKQIRTTFPVLEHRRITFKDVP